MLWDVWDDYYDDCTCVERYDVYYQEYYWDTYGCALHDEGY